MTNITDNEADCPGEAITTVVQCHERGALDYYTVLGGAPPLHPCAAAPASGVNEDFNGAAGTVLGAPNWSTTNRDYPYPALQLDGAGSAIGDPVEQYGALVRLQALPPDQWVEVDFIVPTGISWNIRFNGRVPNATASTSWGYGASLSAFPTTNNVQVRKDDSPVAAATVTFTLGQHTARVEIRGNVTTVLIDGVQKTTYTDTANSFPTGPYCSISCLSAVDKITALRAGAL